MATAVLEFDTAVFCDDIRREDNGKVLLIGVYITDFLTEEFPVNISMLLHTQGNVLEAGQVTSGIIVKDDDGVVLFKDLDMNAVDFFKGRFLFGNFFQVSIYKETTLHVYVKSLETEYEVATRRVRLASTALADRDATALQ